MGLFTKKTGFSEGISNESFFTSHLAHFTQNGAPVVAKTPPLDGGATAVLLPMPNYDNPNWEADGDFLPDRHDDNQFDYSPWLFYGTGLMYFGKNPVTFLFDDPDDAGYIRNDHNPACMIIETLYRLNKLTQCITTPFGTSVSDNWQDLITKAEGEGKDRKFKAVSFPQQMFMAYALLYNLGKTNYLASTGMPLGAASSDNMPILVMTNNCATSSLLPALGETVQTTSGPAIKHPVVTGSKYVHFYDRQKGNCAAKIQCEAEEAQKFGGQRRSIGNVAASQLAGFGVYLSDTLTGRSTDPRIPRAETLRSVGRKVLPWDKAIKGYTPKENAALVAARCGFPLSLLYHAWKSMSEYYPDTLKTALRNPTSVNFDNRPQSQPPATYVGMTHPQLQPAAAEADAPASSGNLWGIPDSVPTPVIDEAPWGGKISDPPSMTEVRAQTDDTAGGVNPAASAVDPAQHKAMSDKLREHMRAQSAAIGGAKTADRARAAQTPPK